MAIIRKISKGLCSKCQYRTKVGVLQACNYLAIEGRSRIYENREAAFDPTLCDKFKKGEALRPYKELTLIGANYEEFTDYKCVKVQKERSTYAYKHR